MKKHKFDEAIHILLEKVKYLESMAADINQAKEIIEKFYGKRGLEHFLEINKQYFNETPLEDIKRCKEKANQLLEAIAILKAYKEIDE